MSPPLTPAPYPWSTISLEWGIGSIILALLTIVLVPAGLLMAAIGLTVAQIQWTEENFANASLAANIALVVCGILAFGSLFAAVMGFVQGLALRNPRGLCITGFILGVAAVGAVIFAINVVIAVKDDVRRGMNDHRATQPPPVFVTMSGRPR